MSLYYLWSGNTYPHGHSLHRCSYAPEDRLRCKYNFESASASEIAAAFAQGEESKSAENLTLSREQVLVFAHMAHLAVESDHLLPEDERAQYEKMQALAVGFLGEDLSEEDA